MRTKFLFSAFILTTLTLSEYLGAQASNAIYDASFNVVDDHGMRQGYWKIVAGMKKLGAPWAPTQVVAEGNYIDSKQEGVWVSYHQNATKCSEVAYKAGRREGTTNYFDNAGSIISSSEYVNGKRNGLMTTYYPNGTKWTEFTWKDGMIDGPAKTYYPNGQLCEEGYWLHNTWMFGGWSGTYILYNDKGSVLRTHY